MAEQVSENKSKRLNSYLWTEKYRPESISVVILPKTIKNLFGKFIEQKEVPNILLYSSTPGTGKTTVAKALLNDCNYDYLYINSSSENGIDVLRDRISKFASMASYDDRKKAVILDEFDGASINLQSALRAFIEEFHNHCRFIITCNYVTKIIEPLKSRLQLIDFNFSDEKNKDAHSAKIYGRLSKILVREKIDFDESVLKKIIATYYPDMRRMLNILQRYSTENGIINNDIFNYDKIDEEFYELILNRKITQAREYIIQKNYNYDELFRALFDNLIPKMDKSLRGPAIVTIAQYQYWSSQVLDKEINFTACLIELISLE